MRISVGLIRSHRIDFPDRPIFSTTNNIAAGLSSTVTLSDGNRRNVSGLSGLSIQLKEQLSLYASMLMFALTSKCN